MPVTLGQLLIIGVLVSPIPWIPLYLITEVSWKLEVIWKEQSGQVLFSSGFMYSHTTCIRESIHLTKKLKVTSKIQFQSAGPLNKINILFSSLPLHQASSAPPYWLVVSLASSLDCNNVCHAQWPHWCFFYMMQIAPKTSCRNSCTILQAGFNECTFWTWRHVTTWTMHGTSQVTYSIRQVAHMRTYCMGAVLVDTIHQSK